MEHITNKSGVVIIRGGTPVDGPRKSRYKIHNTDTTKSYLDFIRYVYLSLFHAPKGNYVFNSYKLGV